MLDTDAEIEVSNINDNSGNLQGSPKQRTIPAPSNREEQQYKTVLMYILCITAGIRN